MTAPSITEFCLARIGEWEAAAQNATWSHWSAMGVWADSGDRDWCVGVPDQDDAVGRPIVLEALGANGKADVEHAVRHDPSRVLAQCAALRAVVEAHPPGGADSEYGDVDACMACQWDDDCGMPAGEYPCPTVRHIAGIWRDHDDWREEWAA